MGFYQSCQTAAPPRPAGETITGRPREEPKNSFRGTPRHDATAKPMFPMDASWQMWHVDPASAGHATTAAAAAFAARSDAYAIQAGPRRTASHPFATQAARASDSSSSNANMRATRY